MPCISWIRECYIILVYLYLFFASSAFLRSLSLLLGCIAGTSVVGDLLITGDVRAAGAAGADGEARAAGETLVATVDTNGDFFLGRPFLFGSTGDTSFLGDLLGDFLIAEGALRAALAALGDLAALAALAALGALAGRATGVAVGDVASAVAAVGDFLADRPCLFGCIGDTPVVPDLASLRLLEVADLASLRTYCNILTPVLKLKQKSPLGACVIKLSSIQIFLFIQRLRS
jgi:hypothetical protein